ncbi:MAG: DUF2156 domain-containing protein [Rubrobacter sp.]|nr:DUF2156 domain-containing protein [Rubrobacter sp.]
MFEVASRSKLRYFKSGITSLTNLRFNMLKMRWPVRLVASIVFLNGLLEVLYVLVVPIPDQADISDLLPFGLHYWTQSLSLIFGFALLYLSFNLFGRKQVAWWLAVVCSTVVMLDQVIRGFAHGWHWYTALVPTTTLMLLIVLHKRFTVRSEPRSIVRGIGLVTLSVALALAYGTLGFWLLDEGDFGIDFRMAESFARTLREYLLIGNNDLVPHTRQAEWFIDSLDLAGLIAASVAAYSLFRPMAYRLKALPHDYHEAKSILKGHGNSSLDFFKLWDDKSYFFSEDRRSFLAYKTSNNVALALGDPVGPEQELESLTRAFVHYCSDNGWRVAFYSVVPELLPMYRQLGMQVLKIGEEAMIDLEHFRSQTARRKKFRWVKRKLEREGYFLTQHAPPHPQNLLDQIEEISEEWLSLPGRRERCFTLGSFDRGYVSETRLFVVWNSEEHPLAFANEVPSYKQGEATIDLMRYRLDVPNGTMDYLLMELMLALREEGYRLFDLGLAPLAGLGDRPGASLEERALSRIYEYLNRFFSYKGLRNYKAKFEPNWEERFLVYSSGLPGLVKTGLALRRATER